MKSGFNFAIVIMLISNVAFGGSVAGTGGSLEVTQLIQVAQDVDNTIREISRIQRLIRQAESHYRNLERNTRRWKSMNWSNSVDHLNRLRSLIRQGTGLVYTARSIDGLFEKKFRGYKAYREEKSSPKAYSDQYRSWSETNRETIKSSMKEANLQAEQFETEEETLKTLEEMGKSSDGRMKALQVSNKLALEEIRQLQKVRSLMLSQMKMQASYMASENDKKSLHKANSEKFFKYTKKIDTTDGNRY